MNKTISLLLISFVTIVSVSIVYKTVFADTPAEKCVETVNTLTNRGFKLIDTKTCERLAASPLFKSLPHCIGIYAKGNYQATVYENCKFRIYDTSN
jgi:hypothetical protein